MPVNFYILTFKRKIVLSFILILINLIIFDISLDFIANLKTTKTTFINNKFSKIRHLQLNNPHNKDIIFMGSSKTLYHVSTNIFRKNNINIYNLGISGAQFEDYPAFMPYLKTIKPKKIVISLPVISLYWKLEIAKYPTQEELKYYYDIDKVKFLQSSEQWIVNRHLFLQYSEPIFYKIKSVYRKFDVKNKFKQQDNNQSLITKPLDYSELVDCNVFDIKHTSDIKTTLKCSNGDGAIIGNHVKPKERRELKHLKKLNPQSIKYLQKMISSLTENNIEVSIILEPMLHNNYEYKLDEIKQAFGKTEIIDLTNFNIKDEFWSDNSHLNYKGREKYSKYLLTILK